VLSDCCHSGRSIPAPANVSEAQTRPPSLRQMMLTFARNKFDGELMEGSLQFERCRKRIRMSGIWMSYSILNLPFRNVPPDANRLDASSLSSNVRLGTSYGTMMLSNSEDPNRGTPTKGITTTDSAPNPGFSHQTSGPHTVLDKPDSHSLFWGRHPHISHSFAPTGIYDYIRILPIYNKGPGNWVLRRGHSFDDQMTERRCNPR